jgi:23S rRNA (pseudouridine1915-N3)-methyltransferase
MKLWLICVGRPGRLLAAAIAEYEARASRYWPLEVMEVREQKAVKGMREAEIRRAEAERILKRAPQGAELVALTRMGDALSSVQLARQLERAAAQGGSGIAWVIGGAYGLDETVVRAATRTMTLSTYTMPHDLARLVLLEQLYRAGTIVRGEPYHKGTDEA